MRIASCDDDGQGLVLKNRNGIVRIEFARIEYVEVIDKIVSFYLTDGRVLEVTIALTDLEEKLLSRPEFLKVHRSYLVNLCYVQVVNGGNIVTNSGHIIPVARKRRSEVLDAYMHFLDSYGKMQTGLPEKRECYDGPFRILLVDDEPADRTLWADILRSHGCMVHIAATGEEAVRRAAEELYHCVLLDVMLPGEDGFSLCKKLSKLARAPVIFLSCLTETDKQMEGFKAGGIDYITKDTPAGLFWAKVDTRIRQTLSDSSRLRYGPLLLDLSGRKVYINEKDIGLTPMEFELLWRLSQQEGHIFTLEELFRTIWCGQPWDGGQVVQMHMSRLRRKLEKAWGEHSFIETVWGQGYRFISPEGE